MVLASAGASLLGLQMARLVPPIRVVSPPCTCVSLCDQISSSYGDTSQNGLGPP